MKDAQGIECGGKVQVDEQEFREFLLSIQWLNQCEIRWMGDDPMRYEQVVNGQVFHMEHKRGDLIDPVIIATMFFMIRKEQYTVRGPEAEC